MSTKDWIAVGIVGLFLKAALSAPDEENSENYDSSVEIHLPKIKKRNLLSACEIEYQQNDDISQKRQSTPCRFLDGITADEFTCIVHKVRKRFARIKEVSILGAVVYCTASSQTGYSDWKFTIDFNNWGHITGAYWSWTENLDSNIPEHFGDAISEQINKILAGKSIYFPNFNKVINEDKEIGTSNGLNYNKSKGLFGYIFNHKRISIWCNSQDIIGEHVYYAVSYFKKNGFKKIKTVEIKDIDCNSNNYNFEVKTVSASGNLMFSKGTSFPKYAEIIITYHSRQEIVFPFSQRHFKKKYHTDVVDELKNLGFSNIHEKQINDLIIGKLIKDGSVDQIMINKANAEELVAKNVSYLFDSKIIVYYHSFKKEKYN